MDVHALRKLRHLSSSENRSTESRTSTCSVARTARRRRAWPSSAPRLYFAPRSIASAVSPRTSPPPSRSGVRDDRVERIATCFFLKKTSPHSEAAVRRVRTSTHCARRDRARTARAMRLDGRRRLRGRGRRCARVDVDARRRPRRVVAGVVDDADERELARVERWRDHARGVARARAR